MNRPLVLIVEDEVIVANDLKEILNWQGYKAIVNIFTVEQAIALIEEYSPALVLIDIDLKQEKDGVDLGAYLLQKDKIPYIYVTSASDKVTLERVAVTRPYGYIVKPFKAEDIIATVSIVLSNFRYRSIDVQRTKIDIDDDIPFILKQSIAYIHNNINQKIKISELAEQTKWKSQHYNRLFTKFIGVTPYQYVMEKKIEKAKALLSETESPVTNISSELGFKSHSNFCSVFKKATSKTPEKYRKWHMTYNEHIV